MSTSEHPQDADPEKTGGYGANAEPDDNETVEQQGEVGETIRRATSDDDAVDRGAHEDGEVGEAIRRSTDEP